MNTLDKLIESGLYVKGTVLNLHLGCGQNRLDGFINIDFPQSKHNVMKSVADADADIVKDLQFPENSVNEIRLYHVYEHFSRVIALAQLVKWHCWLKIDGILVIETPDFFKSIEQIVSEGIDYKQKMAIVRHLTGDQSAAWGYHLDQWGDERFETTLSKLGFHITNMNHSKWDRWPYLCSVIVTATKLNNVLLPDQIEQCLLLLKDSMVSEREAATFEIWKKQLIELLEE